MAGYGPGTNRRKALRLHEWLPADPAAPAMARRLLARLGDEVPESLLDDLRVVVTELVTNSLRHSSIQPGDRIELVVELGPSRVRATVSDPGPGFVASVQPTRLLDTGGRGLLIVGELCQDWGVQSSPGGCSVWCTMAAGAA